MAVVWKSGNNAVTKKANENAGEVKNPNITFGDNDYQKLLNSINSQAGDNEQKRKKLLYDAALGMAQSEMENQSTDEQSLKASIDKHLHAIQKANGEDGSTSYNGEQLRDDVIGGQTMFGKVGNAINDFNKGIGTGLDWVVDRVGDIAGGITQDEGVKNSIYNATNGEMLSIIPSIVEDIGLLALPGGIGLAAGKAALENGANIDKFITGKDAITGQELGEGDKWGALGQVALGSGLAALPGLSKITKVATKGAGDALNKVVGGMAKEGKFNEAADKIVADNAEGLAKLETQADEAYQRAAAAKDQAGPFTKKEVNWSGEEYLVPNESAEGQKAWARYNELKGQRLGEEANKLSQDVTEQANRFKTAGTEGNKLASGAEELATEEGAYGLGKRAGDYFGRGGITEGVMADRVKAVPRIGGAVRDFVQGAVGSLPSGTVNRSAARAMKSGAQEAVTAAEKASAAAKEGLDKQFAKGANKAIRTQTEPVDALKSAFEKIKADPVNVGNLTAEEQKAMSAYGRYTNMGEAEWQEVLSGNKDKLKAFEDTIKDLESNVGAKEQNKLGNLGEIIGLGKNNNLTKFNQIYNGAAAYNPKGIWARAVNTPAMNLGVAALSNPGDITGMIQGQTGEQGQANWLPFLSTLAATAFLRKPMSKVLAKSAAAPNRALSNLGRYSASSGKAYDMARLSAMSNLANRGVIMPKYTEEQDKKVVNGSRQNTDKLIDFLKNRSNYYDSYLAG